jgi:DNA-binding transcriptional LysR family regulator
VALSTNASVMSRTDSRLKGRLLSQLLQRTTRCMGLTEAARLYLEQHRLSGYWTTPSAA